MQELPCNKGAITLINTHKKLIVVDPGVIGRRLSAPSWCEYTLMPHLVKIYGTTTIDHLICLQPNKIIFEALTSLQEKMTIKNLYLVRWTGKIPLHWWISYKKLLTQCQNKHCTVTFIYQYPKKINDTDLAISIIPLSQIITMPEFSYPCLQVHALADNQPLDIYSAKYKHGQKK